MKRFVRLFILLGFLLLPCFINATLITPDFTYSDSTINGDDFVGVGGSKYQTQYTLFQGLDPVYCIKPIMFDGFGGGFGMSILLCDGYETINGSNSIDTNYNNNSAHCKKLGSMQYAGANKYFSDLGNTYNCYRGYKKVYYFAENSSHISLYNGISSFFASYDLLYPNQMTSLECQTEYNLIPISEVTKNYCELNFDLIDPVDCPSGGGCSGSGESIVFSNVYVNNVLYPGGADIYLNINELLATEISYNSQLMYVDVDFDGDEDYINNIIDINSYLPTSEDFTQIFVGGLVRLFPYIVISLFILFVRKLIRKIFK